MRSSFFYLSVFWVICFAIGWAVLTPFRAWVRDLWLPAAPVLGAAFLVVGLHATSLFWGTSIGVWLVACAAAGFLVVGIRRNPRALRPSRAALLATASTAAIGVAGAYVALLPNLLVGSSRVVMASANHDAFYYISEAAWLSDHPMTSTPVLGATPADGGNPPVFGPAYAALTLPLRIGQPLAFGALTGAIHVDGLVTFMPAMGVWVMMGAGAVFVAARLLGGTVGAALVASSLVSATSLVSRAAYDQHSDSLLGMAMVTVTIAALIAASTRHHPRWPAALLTAALMGTYVEYAVAVGPAVLACVVISLVGRRYHEVRRLLSTLLLAVALSPVAWVRGILNLGVSQSGGDSFSSPFLTDSAVLSMGRILGSAPVASPTVPVLLTMAVAVALVIGTAAGLSLRRSRAAFAVAAATMIFIVIFATWSQRGYLQDRVVTLAAPLVITAGVLGWGQIAQRLRHSSRRRATQAASLVAASCLTLAALSITVNLTSAVANLDRTAAAHRFVSPEYDAIESWIAQLGGVDGGDVTVVVPDLFQQLWVAYELRHDSLVSYVSLHPDYLYKLRYWGGESDRYLLVGPGAPISYPDDALVRQSEHFRLLDTSRGPVTVVAPDNMPGWSHFVEPDGRMQAGPEARLLILRSPSAPTTVKLTLAANEPSTVTITGDATSKQHAVGPSPVPVRLSVKEPVTQLTLTARAGDRSPQLTVLDARWVSP